MLSSCWVSLMQRGGFIWSRWWQGAATLSVHYFANPSIKGIYLPDASVPYCGIMHALSGQARLADLWTDGHCPHGTTWPWSDVLLALAVHQPSAILIKWSETADRRAVTSPLKLLPGKRFRRCLMEPGFLPGELFTRGRTLLEKRAAGLPPALLHRKYGKAD